MHFAYPPRKNSTPAPFRPRSTKLPTLRPRSLKIIGGIGLAVLFLIWWFSGSGSSKPARVAKSARTISGTPAVVVVTVLDHKTAPADFLEQVKENRLRYAEKYGYGTHIVDAHEYDGFLGDSPRSWAKVPAVRHAITKFPNAGYFFYLEQNSLIMDPTVRLDKTIMTPARLEEAMIRDHPVVPPDSIIKTFSHLKGEDVNLVLTQDAEGLSVGSFILRNGQWAKFFLDTWFDPLYKSYNFQKAETHALEHIVQWHPTILSKLVLIPQKVINAYSKQRRGEKYDEGDFVVRFPGCHAGKGDNNCAVEAAAFTEKWKAAFSS